MDKQKANIIWFKDLNIEAVPLVGGKNAALGEMFANLTKLGINVPNGFAVTAKAYNEFLDKAGIRIGMEKILKDLDTGNMRALQKAGKKVRRLILKSSLPKELEYEISAAYRELGKQFNVAETDVAVRSSATAEDLPDSSFAGQQETYLNVVGIKDLLSSVKKCIASLFTDRAISYRQDRGFAHTTVALSVGVQKMVRADKGASGVAFSIDTETGFDKVVVINASYGLGEMIVQGKVTPDEFVVFKPTLAEGKKAIVARDIGVKDVKMIYGRRGTEIIKTSSAERAALCLSDEEILKLADWVVKIEKYFSEKKGHYQPMDIE